LSHFGAGANDGDRIVWRNAYPGVEFGWLGCADRLTAAAEAAEREGES